MALLLTMSLLEFILSDAYFCLSYEQLIIVKFKIVL